MNIKRITGALLAVLGFAGLIYTAIGLVNAYSVPDVKYFVTYGGLGLVVFISSINLVRTAKPNRKKYPSIMEPHFLSSINKMEAHQIDDLSLAEPYHFKGIVYVRLSYLPGEQKTRICESYYRDCIVKILKGNSLMNDCMLYTDYVEWHQQYKPFQNYLYSKTVTMGLLPQSSEKDPVHLALN